VNEIFISAAVKGTLMMDGGSVDLVALQTSVADSKENILPAEQDVWRATRTVWKKWWCSFGYNYVLAAILQAKLRKINVRVRCV
jgi:hypothetical protein